MTPLDRAKDLVDVLRQYRMAQTTEARLQACLAEVFTKEGVSFTREERLGPGSRPDFWVEPGVCVEVKIKGSITSALRQVFRYAEHERVGALILVTAKARHALSNLPEEVAGKPLQVVYVGGFV